MSAETLARRLPHCDLGSVYRNLEALEAIGLVRHVHLGHGPGMYALATSARSSSSRARVAARSRRSIPRGSTPRGR